MHLSLTRRLALLFAGCTALVSLIAGLIFNQASVAHFVELDAQLLQAKLPQLRQHLTGVRQSADLLPRVQGLMQELEQQGDVAVRVTSASGLTWFDSRPRLPAQGLVEGLSTLHADGADFRLYNTAVDPGVADSPRLVVWLDITHHQHFLSRMQRLIWLTVGLSALATALLGAWVARRGLRPLRLMSEVAAGVSASSLTTRLATDGLPPELHSLALAFNAMLGRLDDAFQRLSAFSDDLAHELRTPLSNLLTQTQVVLTRPRELSTYRDALLANLEELQWMAQLVNDMLLLAKADHGLLVPGREPLDLGVETAAMAEFYQIMAEDAGITLSHQGQAWVAGDRSMLRRALSNLLDNALRFTPQGGRITLDVAANATEVILSVNNSGPGIAADALPRLFDRFYRADPARHEGSSEHAGLGLAITRSIVRAHGGDIRCESQPGWTSFVIRLPAITG